MADTPYVGPLLPQVRHVSRLLATQLTNAGLGPGVAQVQAWLLAHWWSLQVEERRLSVSGKLEEEEEEEEPATISTVLGGATSQGEEEKYKHPVQLTPAGLGGSRKRGAGRWTSYSSEIF